MFLYKENQVLQFPVFGKIQQGVQRSRERIPLYEKLDTVKIDVSEKTVTETVNEIMELK